MRHNPYFTRLVFAITIQNPEEPALEVVTILILLD